MEDYFTISEFASLRGININSLRYYEKIGILRPAYIDPLTKYRYYSIDQINILNQVILCTTLGVPLKELKKFINDDGSLDSKQLLQDAQCIATNKIKSLQNNLDLIKYMLADIDQSQHIHSTQKKYVRKLKDRMVVTSDSYAAELGNKKAVRVIAGLYKSALNNGYLPILPAGRILHIISGMDITYRFFIEVIGAERNDKNITILPTGRYTCMNLGVKSEKVISYLLGQKTLPADEMIIDNIHLQKYSFLDRPCELQYIKKKPANKDC